MSNKGLSSILAHQPDQPLLVMSDACLRKTARRFTSSFPGLVTYAVKANDDPQILTALSKADIGAFDVASLHEIKTVRQIDPKAVLHYNNPVRSADEIAQAARFGIASWSVDDATELAKLRTVPRPTEIAVRFALPMQGAAYDFGSKFGATPELAATLLRQVAEQGFTPALTFHPGTQCEDPGAWARYISKAHEIATNADVKIDRINVGGGFAADRGFGKPDHLTAFALIQHALKQTFGSNPPKLICEPGRAMVAEAGTLVTRVKSLRNEGATVYLNDGIYGGLADLRDMGLSNLVQVMSPDGVKRHGMPTPRVVFGPTCDSLDRLPDGLGLPADTQIGDYVLFGGMGAYSSAISTRFNGYGVNDIVMLEDTAAHLTQAA